MNLRNKISIVTNLLQQGIRGVTDRDLDCADWNIMINIDPEFMNSAWIRDCAVDGKENVHTFFRKKIAIKSDIVKAVLTFTADDYCKIYINGKYATCGPAPGYVHHYYYLSEDVTVLLRSGLNSLAVHCYYQGLNNRVWNSADDLCGFKASLKITCKDGSSQVVSTDESWLCFDCTAYASERKFGYDTQFAEDIDLREMPSDWTAIDFDDSDWKTSEAVLDYPHELHRQPTLPLVREVITPAKITKLDDGAWLVDFDREVVGCTAVTASGYQGQVIEIRHAEELTGDGRARYEMRANCIYQEYITLSGAANETAEFYDYKAFRYVELLNYPGELSNDKISVYQRAYPFDNASEMSTSNGTLDAIWDICRLAVKLGTQDSFLDCMSREKGAYLGDAYVTGLSHLYLTGRSEMLKKVLTDFAASTEYCPGMLAVAPGAFHQDIADYSMLFIPLLYEYYLWTGDTAFIKEMQPTVDGILKYFGDYENTDGLLEDMTGKPVMVDWPQNLRDGYDDPGLMGTPNPQSGINTVLNLYYYGTIAAAVNVYATAGRNAESEKLKNKSTALRQILKKKFLGADGFVDTASSEHVSMHPNALALMFEVVDEDEANVVINVLKNKRMKCGVYFAFFVLKGLFNYGEADFACELMTCDDIHSWQTMLSDGATTCMEAWGVEQKWNTSLCHPWASAPVYMTAAEIFGLKPASPGWRKLSFDPKIPTGMDSGELSINIPQGKVTVKLKRENNQPVFTISAPEGVEIIK